MLSDDLEGWDGWWEGAPRGRRYMYAQRIHLIVQQKPKQHYKAIILPPQNISNSKHTNNTTLMAASEEEVKSLLMNVKVESEKTG